MPLRVTGRPVGFLLQLCEDVTELACVIWLLHVATHSCKDQCAAVADASTQTFAKQRPFPFVRQSNHFYAPCAEGCKSSCGSEASLVEGSMLLTSLVSNATQEDHSSQDD